MEDLNYLILVRHGQSEWNAKNLFTGWKDPDLTDQGRDEAEKAGKLLLEKKINLDEIIRYYFHKNNRWDLYLENAFSEITEYCESDVINTYLIYLSYQLLTKIIDNNQKQLKLNELIEFIQHYNPIHMTLLTKS